MNKLKMLLVIVLMLAFVAPGLAQGDAPTAPFVTITPDAPVIAPEVVEIEAEPEAVTEASAWREVALEFAGRAGGIAPEWVFLFLGTVLVGFAGIVLPLARELFLSAPPWMQSALYPVVDKGSQQASQQIASKLYAISTDGNPDNDYLIPMLVTQLGQSEALRREFAEAARGAGVKVTFDEIKPPPEASNPV